MVSVYTRTLIDFCISIRIKSIDLGLRYVCIFLDTEGLITQALLLNNVEAAVELCLKAERFADALIIATTGMIYFIFKRL